MNVRYGDVRHFFAFLPGEETFYYNFLQNRTNSGYGLPTGIEFTNISQNNDSINLNINYTIAPPRNYSYVIFNGDTSKHYANLSDTVYYHEYDKTGYFNFQPGTILETSINMSDFRNFECHGTQSSPVTIRGVGYSSQRTNFNFIRVFQTENYSQIDSSIISSLHLQNSQGLKYIQIFTNGFDQKFLLSDISANSITVNNLSHSPKHDYAMVNLNNLALNISNCSNTFLGPFKLINGTLNFQSTTSFVFQGVHSKLILSGNSIVTTDTSSIVIKDSASLNVKGTAFTCTGPGWDGIKLFNSLSDSIENCTFSKARTSLSFINNNDNSASNFTNRIIKNNTFNVPTGGDYKGIFGENNYLILVQGNRFNLPATSTGSPFYVGLYLKNTSTSEPPEVAGGEEGENETSTNYSLNILNNKFRNGSASMVLANYTSNFLPYYIRGNTFDSLNTNAATLNILGMNITGTIKDNVLTSMQTPMGVHLINSNPDLYNNFLGAKKVSLHLVGHSYPNLAPYISGDELVWTGGRNRLATDSLDNIQLAVQGNVLTDYGRNRFTITNTSYHIYGWVDSNFSTYYSRNNCWYLGGAAKIYLRINSANPPIPSVTYNYGIDCDTEPNPIGWQVDYLGNEVYDSTMLSDDDTGSQPTVEEILAAQCEQYFSELRMYDEAIISLKLYIDTYPNGNYVKDALNNLYSCYLYLDTSSSQSYRNTLFGNLINYAEEKVTSNNYDEDFELLAGDIIAMCDANVQNYNNAMNWYEFIALFYPDPDIRLAASWNYAEIDAIINSGNGGGEKDLGFGNEDLGFEERKEINEFSRLNKIINDNPVMRKLKQSFEKNSIHRNAKIEKELRKMTKDDKRLNENLKKSNELDKLKEDKAKRNIFESGIYTKEQMDNNRMQDMILTTRAIRNEIEIDNSFIILLEYKLSQNYPNPFNPITTIKYQIPKDGLVKIKIYDIAGREVLILVNGLKLTGSYSVNFDGSNLSSGIYFYKLEAGDFVSTKKMILIK